MDSMSWTLLAALLGGLATFLYLLTHYIVKPFRSWLEGQITNVVNELHTTNGTTLGQTVEQMARDIRALKKTTNRNSKRLATLERETRNA
jgi:fructose-specific phosphotransferase system IIC component